VLLLITAAGLALRLVGAGARLSHDEGYSWLVATAPTAEMFFDRMAVYENTPPLFYALLAVLPHDSEFWLRFPSIVCGTLWIPVTYLIGRALFDDRRAALLAAAMVAVAPFAVSYADYSRGFMIAGLALLIALLAAVQRRAVLFVVAGAVALWSEYYALAFLVAFVVAQRDRRWLLVGAAPLVLLAPWAGEFARAQDNLGETKLPSVPEIPTPGGIRDAIVPLVFGEHGAASSGVLRTLQALAVVAVVAWALWRVRSRFLTATLVVVPVLYAIASAVSHDVFRQRYLTALIPIGALALAGAFARTRVLPVVAAACVLLGGAVAIQRAGREYEPDYARAVGLAGDRAIHTNSAVIAFYGRDGDVVLDRPFGMGRGSACPACAVVDDERNGGVRPGLETTGRVGPLVVGVSLASP
jgi:4-amino-4-deoxy-L-arabinose transferase-like glycosyltransferase